MKTSFYTLILLFSWICAFSQEDKAIFLVHSTGTNLFTQGKVEAFLNEYNLDHGTNFQITTRTFPEAPWPWENYPYDYWKLWVGNSCSNDNLNIECLEKLASGYELVIFKHCYPGAEIQPDNGKPDVSSKTKTLANYKLQYRALRNLMDAMPSKKFLIWTLVPLHRLATNTDMANRSNEFVNWVKNKWLTEDGKSHPNIYIFDFFGLAAELDPNPISGKQFCVKYDFEKSHSSDDSHLKKTANELIGPLFTQAVIHVMTEKYISEITLHSISGVNEINVDKGTLEISADIFPVSVLNKTLTWSVIYETGKASINSSGLLTSESNGTVRVIATANDGSGISGEITINMTNQKVLIDSINITSTEGNFIQTDHGQLQLSANILPDDASDKSVSWSVINNTGKAYISENGLLQAEKNGEITAIAKANDNSGLWCEQKIIISNQKVEIEKLNIISNANNDSIFETGTQIQLSVLVSPPDATNQAIDWSVINTTGLSEIDQNGLLTSISSGSIQVIAMTKDGSGVSSKRSFEIITSTTTANHDRSASFDIFPNPTSGKFHLKISNFNAQGLKFKIQNSIGQILVQETLVDNQSDWSLKNFSGNIFFVILTNNHEVIAKKILKL